jgi:hypothetical protein
MNDKNETDRNEQAELAQYLKDCVRIEPLALEEEFVRMPADLAYWNERYAKAVRAHLIAKIDGDRSRAWARQALRIKFTNPENAHMLGGGKVTEALLESHITVYPSVRAADDAEIEAEAKKIRLHGIIEAIRTKRDMLISLGANMRAEMQNDPMIKNEQREAREQRKQGGSYDRT